MSSVPQSQTQQQSVPLSVPLQRGIVKQVSYLLD